ncbi:hypothetical protein [Castellaniella sp.]|uniref:hypothetical protein n=1 Tax=Castellaniella sp. TaxID=1955812 RepID=UPI002AFE1EE7|nr:hypothetical protein [Castellaniella sp.]
MKAIRYPLILAAVAFLSACSSSPSDGDIKEALSIELLKGCPSLSISKATKINGIPDTKSDKIYGIETEFTVELKPIKENKKIASDLPGHIKEIQKMQSQYERRIQREKEIKQENRNLDYEQITEMIESDPELQKLKAEVGAFNEIYPYFYTRKGYEEQILRDAMVKRIEVQCLPLGIAAGFTLRYLPKEATDFKDNFYTKFKGTFILRKTDNGWRIAN